MFILLVNGSYYRTYYDIDYEYFDILERINEKTFKFKNGYVYRDGSYEPQPTQVSEFLGKLRFGNTHNNWRILGERIWVQAPLITNSVPKPTHQYSVFLLN